MRHYSILTGALILLGASCGSNSQPSAQETTKQQMIKADVVKFIKHDVIDYKGTGKVAMSYLLPEGWISDDSLYWLTTDPNVPIRYAATYKSKDALSTIENYPDFRLVWTTGPMGTQGMPPPGSVLKGLKKIIPLVRPGIKVRIIEEKMIPGIDPPTINQGSIQGNVHSERGMIKAEYEKNGQTFEEEYYGQYLVNTVVSQGVVYSKTVGWNLTDLFSVSAQKGKLDDCKKVALTARCSFRVTKTFFNRFVQVVQLLQNQYYQQIYQAGQISKIISATNDQMLANIDAQYQNAQKSNDKLNQNFSDYMRGVDNYSDGSGSTVQLPSGYQNAWINDKGEYLLSNTPGFDPSVYYKENWKLLQRPH